MTPFCDSRHHVEVNEQELNAMKQKIPRFVFLQQQNAWRINDSRLMIHMLPSSPDWRILQATRDNS